MEEFSSKKNAHIPAKIEMMPEALDIEEEGKTNSGDKEVAKPLHNREVINNAFSYFTTFKGLLVDLIFSFRERNESRKFFRKIETNDAFRVIKAELNFFYDVLYTKAAVVHCPAGYLLRAISIGCIITAFALFYVLNEQSFHEYDIKITYTLLLGDVGLEFVALTMLICSDWTIALLRRSEKHSPIKSIFIEFLLKFKSEDSSFALRILHARWSKSIFQYNLIDSQRRRWPKWIEKFLDFISLRELFDDWKFGREEQYIEELGELFLSELKQNSTGAEDPESIKKTCAARGKWVLEQSKKQQPQQPDCEDLLPFVRDVDYGESLLLWHIATELCYNAEEMTKDCKISEILSDYMLHLMIKQSNMMSTVAGIGKIRFRDTCAEMDKFISDISEGSKKEITMEFACKSLLSIPTEVKPVDVKGDRSKSALFDACILANKLKSKEIKWKIISEVWVELLGYAAIYCRPYNHAQQLSKGGELVTLVWLLMVHLGLSEQFQIVEGHTRAKLIVQK